MKTILKPLGCLAQVRLEQVDLRWRSVFHMQGGLRSSQKPAWGQHWEDELEREQGGPFPEVLIHLKEILIY